MPKPIKLLNAAEVVAVLDSLNFDELVELNELTAQAQGDAAYTVIVSEWNERSRTKNEHTRRRQGQRAAAEPARRKTR